MRKKSHKNQFQSEWLVPLAILQSTWNYEKRTCAGALSASTKEIEPFTQKLTKIMADLNFLKSEIYNADETGLFQRSLPENTQSL
jgi:hypothetical protein